MGILLGIGFDLTDSPIILVLAYLVILLCTAFGLSGSPLAQALALVGDTVVYSIWLYWLSTCTGIGLSGYIFVEPLALLALNLHRL